jgi:hypothetical protein
MRTKGVTLQLSCSFQSFRNEVITWMCLGRHPNIVPFRGQATIRSIGTVLPVCLVSNWMIEGTLSSFLRRNPSEHKLKYVRPLFCACRWCLLISRR